MLTFPGFVGCRLAPLRVCMPCACVVVFVVLVVVIVVVIAVVVSIAALTVPVHNLSRTRPYPFMIQGL